MSNRIKTIAFYLPQFHAIPENDAAYGVGFTEWTNVKKAVPLFKNHNQPRTPFDNNYYNLLDIDVLREQVKLAKLYGIYGFCYYHYWFNGHRLLEKPLEMMLAHTEIDMPFCICWANENWTKRWDGGNNEVIVSQDYGDDKDIYDHVDYLCNYFLDDRYIKINGAPLLIIYKPEIIPNLNHVIEQIRMRGQRNGFKKIMIAVQYPTFYLEGYSLDLFDYYIQFQPRFVQESELISSSNGVVKIIKRLMLKIGKREEYFRIKNHFKNKNERKELIHRDYDYDWSLIINYKVKDKKLIAGAFVDWDNTPRNRRGLVYDGTSPTKFAKYFKELVFKVIKEYSTDFIFINAWNEWGEGCYLEPDTKNEYAYLEAIRSALS